MSYLFIYNDLNICIFVIINFSLLITYVADYFLFNA
jgi:hypothetical protein